MSTIKGSSKKKKISLFFIGFVTLVSCYTYKNHITYESINVTVKNQAAIEYGSAKYDIKDLVNTSGEIVSIKENINTKVVGPQEVIVEVKKDNVVRELPVLIEVVDTTAPVINLEKDTIEVVYGTDYDLEDNIKEVIDEIDGDIEYQDADGIDEYLDSDYYTIISDSDIKKIGNHTITVKAVDKYDNITSTKFTLKVKAAKKVYKASVYKNLPANKSGNGIVDLAYSLLGSRYVSGGTSPAGFDCSGFVQYVYAQHGISVSRSASTQIYDGVAVSMADAKPGDILSWGYTNGVVTHSAIYVGNGMMIHAANPAQGVILSNVAAWQRGSNVVVLSVRRI